MGGNSSRLEKAIAESTDDERYFGLENFGNTCYCNSVLQALYFCVPFRERVLEYAARMPKDAEDNILMCLSELFQQIHSQKKRTGTIQPKRLVQRVKEENVLFRGHEHQDAHEFLNFILNTASELLQAEQQKQQQQQQRQLGSSSGPGHLRAQYGSSGSGGALNGQQSRSSNGGCSHSAGNCNGMDKSQSQRLTWVQETFQGRLVSETRCLQCENKTSRSEVFMDLSLEISANTSLTACLKQFSAVEMLAGGDKFACDACGCYQEAQKRILIQQLPRCLILHLKRFKHLQQLQRTRKLMHRVVFPFTLKLRNVTQDCTGSDTTYHLFAVVVHVGSGLQHGHYISLIKSGSRWLFFDDETVEPVDATMVQAVFGSTQEHAGVTMDQGYILFYQQAGFEALPTPS